MVAVGELVESASGVGGVGGEGGEVERFPAEIGSVEGDCDWAGEDGGVGEGDGFAKGITGSVAAVNGVDVAKGEARGRKPAAAKVNGFGGCGSGSGK